MPTLYPSQFDKKRLNIAFELSSKINSPEGERVTSFIDFLRWGDSIDTLDVEAIMEGLGNIINRGYDIGIAHTIFGVISTLDCVMENGGTNVLITKE